MSRRGRRDDLHGVLVVDKPAGVTSAQIVTLVRRRMGARPVGHTGTLDPLATGVLPVVMGEGCKLVSYLIADDKGYEAELELGIETDTLDVEGQVTARNPEAAAAVTEAALRTALRRFEGPIRQVPPMYSAVKVDGRRLHKLAREGVEIEREAREVTVHAIELLSFAPPRARFRVECSKGTFVRTLVADLGTVLGCGAHLTALRRTRSGAFTLDQAVPIETITGSRYDVVPVVELPAVVPLPAWTVPESLFRSVLDGRLLATAHCTAHHDTSSSLPPAQDGQLVKLLTPAGALAAIARLEASNLRIIRVFTYGLTTLVPSANLARSNESNP
jgi:tRNA pseudouridine55 synthase